MHSTSPLEWRDGQPYSTIYGDVYFSRASGIAETRHVFLHHNALAERWQRLARPLFTIAETGFGTGLNFLCAWQLWQATAPQSARLHFVSTEKHPLSYQELVEALALWPELAPWRDQLLTRYRWLAPGWRRMAFDNGRVVLTLLIGDARDTLPRLRARVNAWFLDGFAPARNPEMWQPELFSQIARLSAPGCTFATFTSAGAVRRGLQNVGFHVEKVPGFGQKREMLRGVLSSSVQHTMSGVEEARSVVVIGGGIAGCATASSLARRGWAVTLLERHDTVACEASGNPQGVLYPRLSGHDIPLSRIAQLGFMSTADLLPELLRSGEDWAACGLLQQGYDAREARRCADVLARGLPQDMVRAVDADEAGVLTGLPMPHGGLWFPAGGWVHPPALCRALTDHPGIRLMTACEALQLTRDSGLWQIHGADGTLHAQAPHVIVCAANDSRHFNQTTHLPLQPVRGQITRLPATPASQALRAVVCTDGYITPVHRGSHCLGASFVPDDRTLELRHEEQAANLAMLQALSPALYAALGADHVSDLSGRVALRSVPPDYLPMTGPLLDAALVLQRFPPGSRAPADSLPWHNGLWINTGHGSKGLITAPLCAELLAALLESEPLPMDDGLAAALDPNRFLLRQHGLRRLIGSHLG